MSILPSKNRPIVCLDGDTGSEVAKTELFLLARGLCGRFKGIWPSLREFHKWISELWRLIFDGDVQILPVPRRFFVVFFDSVQDKRKLLFEHQWCWDDRYLLLFKPWHPTLYPTSESFKKIPIWVRLPNLPFTIVFLDSILF
ncbi:hypothetical protein SUGI_1180420 [Cryptomeria japonica]|nr:hypothetical protein SUGI_1180420 [Cryptomeria japonica]